MYCSTYSFLFFHSHRAPCRLASFFAWNCSTRSRGRLLVWPWSSSGQQLTCVCLSLLTSCATGVTCSWPSLCPFCSPSHSTGEGHNSYSSHLCSWRRHSSFLFLSRRYSVSVVVFIVVIITVTIIIIVIMIIVVIIVMVIVALCSTTHFRVYTTYPYTCCVQVDFWVSAMVDWQQQVHTGWEGARQSTQDEQDADAYRPFSGTCPSGGNGH